MNRLYISAAILAVLLAALALRLPELNTVPPGLFFDEASDGLDVVRVARGKQFPIFFEANGGREPLFNYAQALSVMALGVSPFSLRLVAVFAGVLTVALTWALARRLTEGDRHADVVGLLAAIGVAVSFWHLNFSRLGQRAILLPLLLLLTLLFFWRMRATGRWRDALLSGFFLGASLYTYIPARFIPALYVLFWLTELWERPRPLGRWLALRAVLLLAALVVVIPLALYFISVPGAFLGRVQDVAAGGPGDTGLFGTIGQNVARVAGMFLFNGDLEWRHNLAGRPVLDWIMALPFCAGLVLALIRIKRPGARLVCIWLPVMLLPSVLSQGAPDFARAIGALPAVYVLAAWGWEAAAQLLARWNARWATAGLAAACLLSFVASGWITAQDYFVRWANDPRTYKDFEGGMTELANWLNRSQEPVYLPLELYAHPTLSLLTQARFELTSGIAASRAIEPDGIALTARPSAPLSGYVLLSGQRAILLDPIVAPALAPKESVMGRYGVLTAIAPASETTFKQATEITPLHADFSNGLRLIGYRMQSLNGGLGVTLYWQARQRPTREPKVFVHELDKQGAVVAQVDELLTAGLASLDWPIGETIPDPHWLAGATAIEQGGGLEIGLYDLFNGDRMDVTLADGTIDDHIVIEPGR